MSIFWLSPLLIFVGVAGILASRVRSATRLTRLMLAPVLAVAVARLLVYTVGFAGRRVDPDSPLLAAIAILGALLATLRRHVRPADVSG